jgi:hypothetical protein
MNRYNQYQKVDYVGLPIEAYQMVAGGLEAENMAKVAADKNAYDGLQDVEAVYNPDIQLKGKLLEELNTRITELGKKNLKGPDVLMELNKLVNDRHLTDKLSEIYGNTTNYKAAIAAEKKYREDYGNDINIQRGVDMRDAYNKLDANGFKSGVMAGYSPNKYVDVVGDMQKVLEKMKANGWEEDRLTGMWINKKGGTSVTMERLLASSGLMLNDPKYQSQLKDISYYNLKKYGGDQDPKKAILTYNKLQASALDEQLSKAASTMSELVKKRNATKDDKEKAKYDKMIENGERGMKNLGLQRDAYKTDTTGGLFEQDVKTSLSLAASSPFAYETSKDLLEANPFSLAKYKSDLAFNNEYKKWARDRQAELEDRKTLESLHEPSPVISTVQLGTPDNLAGSAVQFNQQGGYNAEALQKTAMNLVNTYNMGSDAKGAERKITVEDREDVAKSFKDGSGSINLIVETNQFEITTPTKTIRVPVDHKTQKELSNLRQTLLFTRKDNVEKQLETVVSNGTNYVPVTFVKIDGEYDERDRAKIQPFVPMAGTDGKPVTVSTKEILK